MKRGTVERISLSGKPVVSLVIPHFYEGREENLRGLLEEIRTQTFKETEILIVHGVSPQGRAINKGAREAAGRILMVMDDDSRMGHNRVIENLVKALRENPSVAMAGASVIAPETANTFQKAAARQFPRFQMPILKELTDSDFACHGCVVFPKDVFFKVGMERDDIIRGLDPDLRVRLRKAGYRVVLVPETWVYHPLPGTVWKFVRTFFRNGYGSAYLQVFYPEINFDTDETAVTGNFVPKRSFLHRILRFPVRLLQSLVTFQWIRFLGYSVYVAGYAWGYSRFKRMKPVHSTAGPVI